MSATWQTGRGAPALSPEEIDQIEATKALQERREARARRLARFNKMFWARFWWGLALLGALAVVIGGITLLWIWLGVLVVLAPIAVVVGLGIIIGAGMVCIHGIDTVASWFGK